jgi:hypothetical protein
MSDQKPVSDESKGQPVTGSDQPETEFVSKRAYEEVARDMHRFKSQAKEAAAARAEYEAKLKQLEEEKMREQNQFKELYERTKQEAELEKQKAQRDREAWLSSVKKSALKNELGKIRDEYLVHADLNGIEFNDDGTLSSESVLRVANKFRQEHGSLVQKTHAQDPTAPASPTNQTVTSNGKSIEQMSLAEKLAAFHALPKSS